MPSEGVVETTNFRFSKGPKQAHGVQFSPKGVAKSHVPSEGSLNDAGSEFRNCLLHFYLERLGGQGPK